MKNNINLPGFTAKVSNSHNIKSLIKNNYYQSLETYATTGAVSPQVFDLISKKGSSPFGLPKNSLDTNFLCSPLGCVCNGYDDCIDMFNTNVCGNIAWCRNNGCYCNR